MPQAMPVPADNGRIVMPYAPTRSEMKRRWVQTAEGTYASPNLAVDESGNRIVKIDWPSSLHSARLASERTGRIYLVASYGEAMDVVKDAIKRNNKSGQKVVQEANEFAEWTRNRYETVAEGERRFTRIFSHLHGRFEDLDYVLENGYVASLRLGAPNAVSEQPNPDFLNAQLYYDNNPVVRVNWNGRFGAGAGFGASDAAEDLGFRLVWYEKGEAERTLREQNRALKEERRILIRRIANAAKELEPARKN